MKVQKMAEIYGLRETTVCINRLNNIAISLERDKAFLKRMYSTINIRFPLR